MEESMFQRLLTAEKRLKEIDDELISEDIMKNMARFKEISKERAYLDPQVDAFNRYRKNEEDIEAAKEMAHDSDSDLAEMGKEELKRLEAEQETLVEQLREMLLPRDPNDDKDIIVEIRGAVGGDEANIFAGDLFRMYTRYAEAQGWKIQILDENPSESGGFAMISFKISGDRVYSKLKFESGAHRVQRVPKTEASGRIHTSTATVLVMPEAEEIDIQINPNDLQIDTYHSQGAGGQNVNKTESAVRITHIPTGTVVACQTEKSQIQNRETAMKMLKSKLLDLKEKEHKEKIEDLKGEQRDIAWGSQIRSYVFCPYTMVKDHRTGYEVGNVEGVMDGDLNGFIEAYLKNN